MLGGTYDDVASADPESDRAVRTLTTHHPHVT